MNRVWMKLKQIYQWGRDTVTIGKVSLLYLCKHSPFLIHTEVYPVLQAVDVATWLNVRVWFDMLKPQGKANGAFITLLQVRTSSTSLCNFTGKALYGGERSMVM